MPQDFCLQDNAFSYRASHLECGCLLVLLDHIIIIIIVMLAISHKSYVLPTTTTTQTKNQNMARRLQKGKDYTSGAVHRPMEREAWL